MTKRDYSKPARTEYEGREYEVELTFRCPSDLTEEQLWEWLQFEWGYGSIASDHPGHDAEINRVEITDLRATRRRYYVDWGETSKDGRCSGKGRVEYDEGRVLP